jgi:hypothetical protein
MEKAKIIWLGEPEGDNEGPRQNVWNSITFKRGEEVEIDNPHMIAKAKRNPFYSVDGEVYVPDGAEPHPAVGKSHKKAGPITHDKTQLSEMTVAELRAEADRRGIDHDGLNKAELREKLAES